MRIGELADAVGVNTKTIRYYEQIGLLPDPPRSPGGYRQYDERDVERLAFIRRARDVDLGLGEVGEILALRDRGERPCDYVLQVAVRRIDELDERINRMQQARDELHELLGNANRRSTGDGGYCELIEHRTDTAAGATGS